MDTFWSSIINSHFGGNIYQQREKIEGIYKKFNKEIQQNKNYIEEKRLAFYSQGKSFSQRKAVFYNNKKES